MRALQILAKKGTVAANAPIICRKVDPQAGREVSLVENCEREPMHPADEFVAFKSLADDGLPVEDIAARFGVSKTVVLQRLKLAAVAPALLKRYRADEMTLEILMAFAVSDDHKRQVAVWDQLPTSNRHPHTIKRALTEGEIPANDQRVRFVGLKVYEKAGGGVRRDLFDDDGAYILEPELLEQLVAEKLEAEAEAVKAEGWSWVETAVSQDYNFVHQHTRSRPETVELSKKDQARLERLEEEYDTLAETPTGQDDDGEVFAKLDAITGEIEALEAKRQRYSKAQKKKAGAYLSVDHDGTLSVHLGLVKPEDRKQTGDDGETSPDASEQPKTAPSRTHSDTLLERLTSHRTLALQAALMASPDLAYDLLVAELAKALYLTTTWEPKSCFLLKLDRAKLDLDEDLAEAKANKAWHEQHQKWALRLPQEAGEVLGFVRSMAPEDKAELLALCLSASVDAVVRRNERQEGRYEYYDQLARGLALDMSDWWQPTAQGYFLHVRKDVALDAVRQVKGDAAAHNLAKLKKADLAEAAEKQVAGTGWLPEPFRVGARAAEAEAEPATQEVAQAAE